MASGEWNLALVVEFNMHAKGFQAPGKVDQKGIVFLPIVKAQWRAQNPVQDITEGFGGGR